ncbi:1,4-dihydroxy-6-naphthoate synthase [Lysinibacillus louembei]|uniref:1,4-dihydroxy-6-naphthoate synthase n=1 Tax=Lysinibacillus louembei TaxID=1470088 RepID=A0ABZ0RV57_9BACI|nr:1,4-dihydroxy-6-naphthoate synthase [Lysinibacillus louembei]WPK12118.1 1,4-dihydroxy-6-naphthoate synthase [Lysinibacillus louembei]
MDIEMDLYTKIFLDTNLEKKDIIDLVSKFVNGDVDGSSIITEQAEIYLFNNGDYIEGEKEQTGDDFLYYRYYFEIEPNESVSSNIYISKISHLLTELWNAGFTAIASCDFEELLPKKGGYNFEQR